MDIRKDKRSSTIFQEVQPSRRRSSAKSTPLKPVINHTKHSCTDVHCLLIFVAFIVAWCYIAQYAWSNGDLNKVLIPTDSKNRKCGIDSGVRLKKYLFFFDLDKCLDPLVPINGCRTKQICVASCPQQTFVWGEDMLNVDLEEVRKSLICDDEVDTNEFKNHAQIGLAISEGRCSGWYLQSSSLFYHCIPFAKVDFCNLVPESLKSRKRRGLTALPNHKEMQQLSSSSLIDVDSLKESFASFKNRTTSLCKKKSASSDLVLKEKVQHSNTGLTKIIAALIFAFVGDGSEKMAEGITEDLKESWKVILLAFVIHLIVVILFIMLLRWVAKPLVWISIFGVIVGLALTLNHSISQYRFWRDSPHVPQHNMNLSSQFQNVIQNYKFWQYLAIVTGAALVIILLILIVIRKRIAIAIAIVKEASKAITSIKSSIFFPIFPGILYIFVTIMASIVLLHLNSIGDDTFRMYKQLNSSSSMMALEKCVCTGPAESYKLQDKCNPDIFDAHCHIKYTNHPCVETVCRFVDIEKSPLTRLYIYFCIFGYLWVAFFISAYGDMVLACTFSMWYWTFNKKDLTSTPLLKAVGITTLYHLGTLAFGSLVLAICRMIRYVLEIIEKKAKLYNNSLTRAILCCMQCFFWLLENFLRFLNRNAYITCAIHSTSFCESSKKAFALITQNILRMYAVDKVSDFLFFLSKLLLTGCTSFAIYIFLLKYPNVILVNYPLVPIVIVAILAYIMANVIFSTYAMAVDTLFFCFLEDSNENDGSLEKPFYMSSELKKVLGKKKTKQHAKQMRNDVILQKL